MKFYMPKSIKELTYLPEGISRYTIISGKMLNGQNDLLTLVLGKESNRKTHHFSLLDYNLIIDFMNEADVNSVRDLEGMIVVGIEDKLNEQMEDLIGLTAISLH